MISTQILSAEPYVFMEKCETLFLVIASIYFYIYVCEKPRLWQDCTDLLLADEISAIILCAGSYVVAALMKHLNNQHPMSYKGIIFLILNQNICCGYSKEPSQ